MILILFDINNDSKIIHNAYLSRWFYKMNGALFGQKTCAKLLVSYNLLPYIIISVKKR